MEQTTAEPVIRVSGVTNRFGPQTIHDELDLEIQRGEIVGIVGGSGTGKSVLLRTILGLHQPQAGQVEVLGRRILVGQPLPHRCWGVLFQSGALFSGLTVRQNVELPMSLHATLDRDARARLAELKINMAGLDLSAADKYPAELSGGMIKRAGLARALALDPKLLFLDEPTAGLDPIAAAEFDQLILYLRDSLDLTVVMITHDLDSLYTLVDRVAVLLDRKATIGCLADIEALDHPWIQQYFHGKRARALEAAGASS